MAPKAGDDNASSKGEELKIHTQSTPNINDYINKTKVRRVSKLVFVNVARALMRTKYCV